MDHTALYKEGTMVKPEEILLQILEFTAHQHDTRLLTLIISKIYSILTYSYFNKSTSDTLKHDIVPVIRPV